MRNTVGFITTTVIMITQLFLPNYATAQSWSSSSTSSNGVQDERYSDLDPAMAVVMVVLVCTFLLMGFISVYIRQCSEQAAPSANSSSYAARIARLGNAPGGGGGGGGYCYHRQGLDRAVIDSFPVLAYISVKELKGGKVSGELECAVCLSEFEEFDSLKLLPKCNHVFHPECIDAWLASHVTCPVCRANLEFKLELDSYLRCGIDNSSSSNSGSSSSSINNNTNVVTNSIQGESNLQQQQHHHHQPQACISAVVSSENRQEEEQEKEERRQILGKLMRSHSTGHSLVIEQVNMEKYNLGSPEEGRVSMWDPKECMRRSISYEVILDLGTSGSGRNSGSSSGKCANFVRTPPPPRGDGCGQGLFMSIKVPISFFGLKVDEEERRRNRPPV